jgi:hypothetical protein
MDIILNRSCGGCTACCKTHAVLEIKKPTGKWCSHCNPGQGCRIYSKHPKSCAEFECQWLKGFGKNEDRPDGTKIVLDLCTGITDSVLPNFLQIWEVSGKALHGSFAKESVRIGLENGFPVFLISTSGKVEIITGNISIPKESLNEIARQGIRIVKKHK